MKVFLVIISLFQLSLSVLGQNKSFKTPKYLNGKPILKDSVIYYSDKKLRIFDMTDGSDSFHIRFSTKTETLDIWTYDYQSFFGKLLLSVKAHNINPDKFYSEVISVDTSTAKKIYNLFQEYSILEIPTQDSIKGWLMVLDGDLYTIEYSMPRIYRLKTYWTPSELDNTKEAKAITNLIAHLYKIIPSVNKSGFVCSLPPGQYEMGNYLTRCTKMHK